MTLQSISHTEALQFCFPFPITRSIRLELANISPPLTWTLTPCMSLNVLYFSHWEFIILKHRSYLSPCIAAAVWQPSARTGLWFLKCRSELGHSIQARRPLPCSSSQQLSLLPLNILWDKQRVLAALRTGFIQCQLLFEQSLKLVIHTEEIFWIADENTRTIPKQLMHTADGF